MKLTNKILDRQRVPRCTDILDQWAQCQVCPQAFAQPQGISYFQVRAWKSFETRWRVRLAGRLRPHGRTAVHNCDVPTTGITISAAGPVLLSDER